MCSSRCRSFAVATLVTAVVALLAHRLLAELLRPGHGPVTLDALVLRASLTALLVCLGWGWFAVLACVADALRSNPREHRRGIPTGLRRLVFVGCGVSLAAAAPAIAATDHGQDPEAARIAALIAGLPLPDRTTDVDPGVRPYPTTPGHRHTRTVEVRAGDSLWRITERLLPGADAEDIARGWRQLYRANRDAVGADPDVIRPGTTLTVPVAVDGGGRR